MTRETAEALLEAMLDAMRVDGDGPLCDALTMLSERLNQNKFRHAASFVRGTKVGRHAIDDRAALRRIQEFPSARQREAVGIVAGEMSKIDGKPIETHARRLRRKMPKKETDKLLMSGAAVS